MDEVSQFTYSTDIRAIRVEDGLNARYCIRKAQEYLDMADVYIADLENEIETLKQQLNGKTSEH